MRSVNLNVTVSTMAYKRMNPRRKRSNSPVFSMISYQDTGIHYRTFFQNVQDIIVQIGGIPITKKRLYGKERFYNLFWGAKVTVQMRVLSAPTFFQ